LVDDISTQEFINAYSRVGDSKIDSVGRPNLKKIEDQAKARDPDKGRYHFTHNNMTLYSIPGDENL